MSDFLEKIRIETEARVAQSKHVVSIEALEAGEFYARRPRQAPLAFRTAGLNVLAEVKFASPSEGDIRLGADPVGVAGGYLKAGARMLSILTEPRYFKGDLEYLRAIRRAYPEALLLRKDFIVDVYQLHEARAAGADAILLIVAMTGAGKTAALYQAAKVLGLSILVEVHDEEELDIAKSMNADFIGVNNRNLKTLKTDLGISHALAAQKPENAVFITESGLKTADDLNTLHKAGYDGFLMGTHFMRAPDPGAALQKLLSEASCA